jgi:NAD-dependent SIR2 family protein deacetylase
VVRPDGDVGLQDAGRGFVVPPCPDCGGVLKPNVVFFGDGVPTAARAEAAMAAATGCDAMLVVGSSLMARRLSFLHACPSGLSCLFVEALPHRF